MDEHLHKDNLEEFFRRSLDDFAEEPPDDWWDELEEKIPPKPTVTRRLLPSLKWVAAAAMLILAIGFVYQFSQLNQRVDSLTKEVESKTETIDEMNQQVKELEEKVVQTTEKELEEKVVQTAKKELEEKVVQTAEKELEEKVVESFDLSIPQSPKSRRTSHNSPKKSSHIAHRTSHDSHTHHTSQNSPKKSSHIAHRTSHDAHTHRTSHDKLQVNEKGQDAVEEQPHSLQNMSGSPQLFSNGMFSSNVSGKSGINQKEQFKEDFVTGQSVPTAISAEDQVIKAVPVISFKEEGRPTPKEEGIPTSPEDVKPPALQDVRIETPIATIRQLTPNEVTIKPLEQVPLLVEDERSDMPTIHERMLGTDLVTPIADLPIKSRTTISNSIKQKKQLFEKTNTRPLIPSFPSIKKGKVELGIFAAPIYSYRNVRPPKGGPRHDRFKEMESGRWGSEWGVQGFYILNKRFAIGGGISYAKQMQHFDMNMPVEYRRGRQCNGKLTTSYGETDMSFKLENNVYDDGQDVEEGDSIRISMQTSKRADYLYLPLMGRLQLGNNRLRFEAGAGLSAGFMIQEKMMIDEMQTSHERVSIKEHKMAKQPLRRRDKVELNYQLSAGLAYYFSDHLKIHVTPTVRQHLQAKNKQDWGKTLPYTVSVQTGMSFNF